MSDSEEEFDLAPLIDEPMNAFKIVHIYNKSKTYHLTRQVLLDSVLMQNTYCFFYHILAKNIEEFNQIYGSFACLIDRNMIQADLYLNVDAEALEHIINYIQTTKINGQLIYADNWQTINEIIDLATMFGMPNLVSMLRGLHPSDATIDDAMDVVYKCMSSLLVAYQKYVKNDLDVESESEKLLTFMQENRQSIIDTFIKTNMYKNELIAKFALTFISPMMDK